MKHSSTPPALAHLDAALQDLAHAHLLRERPSYHSEDILSFCSNDYLGFASSPLPQNPGGSSASRLIAGERHEHVDLEHALAQWLHIPSTLVFSSGYAANVGTVSALASPHDLIVSDELNHASLIDGARLSKAHIAVVPHLDHEAIRKTLKHRHQTRAWVLTESYFSMDADSPDLKALRTLCDEYNTALLVDEAHALGVLGPEGRGLCAEAGIIPDILIGTFGKAFGRSGAFVAGCDSLIQWLWNCARSFVFSTGISPAIAKGIHESLNTLSTSDTLRKKTLCNAERMRQGLRHLGICAKGFGHIIPWILEDPHQALNIAQALCEQGIHVQAVRPPSVPVGTSRIRFTVTARHSKKEIDDALYALERLHLPTLSSNVCLPYTFYRK